MQERLLLISAALSLLPASLSAFTTSTVSASSALDFATKDKIVFHTATIMKERYIYPDLGERAGNTIEANLLEKQYDGFSEPKAFADRLTSDLQLVTHDLHVRVQFYGAVTGPGRSVGGDRSTDGGIARVDRLDGNIGYIKVLGFPPSDVAAPAMDKAIALIANTDALIIDMRENEGGEPDAVAHLCSFFFKSSLPVHLNDLIWRKPSTRKFRTESYWTKPSTITYLGKPVYVLTSKMTFSGGEEFANDLKTQKRAIVVGETTGGGANPGDEELVGHDFSIFVPNGRARNPITGTNWEGVGVKPDIAVPMSKAMKFAALDALSRHSMVSLHGRALDTARVQFDRSDGTLDPLVEAHLMSPRTGPQTGSEMVLRNLLAALARGDSNYDRFGRVADMVPQLRDGIADLGRLENTTFVRVGAMGEDVFEARFSKGSLRYYISVTKNGKIADIGFGPA